MRASFVTQVYNRNCLRRLLVFPVLPNCENILLQVSLTKRRRSVVGGLVSYSGGPGFKSWPKTLYPYILP